MRYYFLLRCIRFKILVVILVVFTCLTLINELFASRRTNKYSERNMFETLPETKLQQPSPVIPILSSFVPGRYLKGIYPRNESYCSFNYEKSEMFGWMDQHVSYSPELKETGPYRIVYNFVEVPMNRSANSSERMLGVTYCTHATPEFLYNIVEIVRRWDGPVSVAVFAPGSDAGLGLALVQQLCHCVPEMARTSIHFIFSVQDPPVFSSTDLDRTFSDCAPPEALLSGRIRTFRGHGGLTYPVNVARNVARQGAKTSHILVSDIELLPSKDLVPAFLAMLGRLRKKRQDIYPLLRSPDLRLKYVFVVPVFEVESSEADVPRSKEKLLELYAQNRAVYFHRWVCLHCQRFPGLQKWLQRKPSSGNIVQPLMVVRREFPYHRWEPIYISTNHEPLYSEKLSWEGQQDKMTQMSEMCLMGYRFVILDGAFLVHTPGIKRRSDVSVERTAWRKPHHRQNIHIYENIVGKMMQKYGPNNRCKI